MSQQINLFNPAFEKRKQALSALGLLQGLGLVLAASAAVVWFGARQVAALERTAADAKVVLDAREARRAFSRARAKAGKRIAARIVSPVKAGAVMMRTRISCMMLNIAASPL